MSRKEPLLLELGNSTIPLLPSDISQHYAITVRKAQTPLILTLSVDQLRVTLEHIHCGIGVLPRLLKRVADHLLAAVGLKRNSLASELFNRTELPVFHFQKQQPAPGMQHDKIGVTALSADGNVVPDRVIIFQQGFQPAAKTPLAAGHTPDRIKVGDNFRHGAYSIGANRSSANTSLLLCLAVLTVGQTNVTYKLYTRGAR